jgi:anti-anti-sigma factor
MELSSGRNLLVERPAPGVWVARFTRPDLRPQLDGIGVDDCALYQDLKATLLDRLAQGDRLVLNFGLVLYFSTAFYQVVAQLRHDLQAKQVRLLLCALVPEVREVMQVMRADKVFEIVHTEEQAVRKATRS